MDDLDTLTASGVRISILGGLNGFGMNCALWETADSAWLIDCGVAFARHNEPGIDYHIPDFSVLDDLGDKFQGVIATHGHEDHIGAIPFLARHLDRGFRVVGSAMTERLLTNKMRDRDLEGFVDFQIVEDQDLFDDGFTTFEFIHVNHSIPGALAIKLRTDEHQVIFTGDWRLDPTSPDEVATNLASFGGDRCDVLFADSTNSTGHGVSRSEATVAKAIRDVLRSAEGRVVIAQFSSHVRRAVEVMVAAAETGRRVGVVGASLKRAIEFARDAGYVTVPSGVMLKEKEWENLPESEIVLIVTGTQAEPRASLTRASRGEHHLFELTSEDTVVHSARVIPGNEGPVYDMLNAIAAIGATIVTERDAPVHTSGHAYSEEMKALIATTQPAWVAPVHGDLLARFHHAELAESCGANVLFLEDGDVVLLGDEPDIVATRELEEVIVEGYRVGPIDGEVMRQRRQIGHVGVVCAYAQVKKGTLVKLKIKTFGVDAVENEDPIWEECADFVREMYFEENPDEIHEFLRTSIRRFYRKYVDRKPVVISFVD